MAYSDWSNEKFEEAIREFVADAVDYYLGADTASEYVNDIPGASALTDDEWDEALARFKKTAREAKVVFE